MKFQRTPMYAWVLIKGLSGKKLPFHLTVQWEGCHNSFAPLSLSLHPVPSWIIIGGPLPLLLLAHSISKAVAYRCHPRDDAPSSRVCVYVCVAKKVFDHRTYNATKVRLPNSHTRSMHLDLFKACLRITRWLSKCYLTYLLLSNVIGHWLFR